MKADPYEPRLDKEFPGWARFRHIEPSAFVVMVRCVARHSPTHIEVGSVCVDFVHAPILRERFSDYSRGAAHGGPPALIDMNTTQRVPPVAYRIERAIRSFPQILLEWDG
jgi:hypothetical protein